MKLLVLSIFCVNSNDMVIFHFQFPGYIKHIDILILRR